ncbi:MAG: helix-turn-helix transcriptional regulator [Eubacterium sp.]|nr:helix-turn-helix transcriptional regulator [Eubacterium sp.]
MDTGKELIYRLYIQREEAFVRTDIRSEFSRYDDIRNGNVEKVKENFKEIKKDFFKGKGTLSKNPLRNTIYHFVVAIGVVSRICIKAGMPHDEAYTISDIYIQAADECKTIDSVIDLLEQAQIDFATRMRKIYKNNKYSIYVRHAIDYIYDHLHEQITLECLAENENLSPSYFSKLFAREIGTPVKSYILSIKINTAKNMLRESKYSISDIAFSLGFSSQSAFTAAYKKLTGKTPARFRKELDYIDPM